MAVGFVISFTCGVFVCVERAKNGWEVDIGCASKFSQSIFHSCFSKFLLFFRGGGALRVAVGVCK